MWIYYLLIALIFLDFGLEFWSNKKLTKNNRFKRFLDFVFKFRLISIFSIILVSSLRAYSVGGDLTVYYDEYTQFKSLSVAEAFKLSRFEFGYTILTFILAKIGFGFRIVLVLSSIFTAICFWKFIKEFSPNKCMSLVLFICFGLFAQSLNIMRHIIALDFILLALICLHKNKIWQSVVLILCSSLFHITALVGLMFILFKYLKPTWQLFAFSVLLVFVGVKIFPYAMKVVSLITPVDFYNQYFVVEKDKFIATPGLMDNLYSLGLALIFVVLFVGKRFLKSLNEKELKIYDFFLVVYMFVPLIRLAGFAMSAQSLLHRLNVWFFFSLIILVPLFIKGLNLNKKWKVSVYCVTYIAAFCYMYYFYAIQASNKVVPYLFCF